MTERREDRSRTMRAVKGRDTGPEMTVRRLAHGMGYRYRLYRKDLPGKPDVVFPARRKVIFVHGCFWHQHHCSRGSAVSKVESGLLDSEAPTETKQRDAENQNRLREMGWDVLVIWECEMKDRDALQARIAAFLDD